MTAVTFRIPVHISIAEEAGITREATRRDLSAATIRQGIADNDPRVHELLALLEQRVNVLLSKRGDEYARTLPPAPKRSLSEIRAQQRADRGRSAYTEALDIIHNPVHKPAAP